MCRLQGLSGAWPFRILLTTVTWALVVTSIVFTSAGPAGAYSYFPQACTHNPAFYYNGKPHINVWDSGSSGAPGTSSFYRDRVADSLWLWNNVLQDFHPVLSYASAPPSPMNIWSTADFYNNPGWLGYNPVTCALDAFGQWKYVDNTIYIDRTDTDNFPWSANGVPGYYGVIGVINHEFGHAMADLEHQAFGGCAITNPIMVTSLDGRWSECGQWGIANDDKWGVDNAY